MGCLFFFNCFEEEAAASDGWMERGREGWKDRFIPRRPYLAYSLTNHPHKTNTKNAQTYEPPTQKQKTQPRGPLLLKKTNVRTVNAKTRTHSYTVLYNEELERFVHGERLRRVRLQARFLVCLCVGGGGGSFLFNPIPSTRHRLCVCLCVSVCVAVVGWVGVWGGGGVVSVCTGVGPTPTHSNNTLITLNPPTTPHTQSLPPSTT